MQLGGQSSADIVPLTAGMPRTLIGGPIMPGEEDEAEEGKDGKDGKAPEAQTPAQPAKAPAIFGQAVVTRPGEWVRYSTPGGAEYIAVCLPAFSPETVHRVEGP